MPDLSYANLSPFWPTHSASAPTGTNNTHTHTHSDTWYTHTHTHTNNTHTHTHTVTHDTLHTHTHTQWHMIHTHNWSTIAIYIFGYWVFCSLVSAACENMGRALSWAEHKATQVSERSMYYIYDPKLCNSEALLLYAWLEMEPAH